MKQRVTLEIRGARQGGDHRKTWKDVVKMMPRAEYEMYVSGAGSSKLTCI